MNLDLGRLVALQVATKNDENLLDVSYIERFLYGLVRVLKMELLAKPISIIVDPDNSKIGLTNDDGGLTAQCIISTSHITIHTWPLQNRFRLVVDSCKDFEAPSVVGYMKYHFDVEAFSIQNLKYEPPTK